MTAIVSLCLIEIVKYDNPVVVFQRKISFGTKFQFSNDEFYMI